MDTIGDQPLPVAYADVAAAAEKERMKIVVEPTGALAAAALLEGKLNARGQRVGIIISGGNVDLAIIAAFRKQAGPSR